MRHSKWFLRLLGAVLVGIVGSIWLWQTPGLVQGRLTSAEIAHYLEIIEKLPIPSEDSAQLRERVRAWAESDDGQPVYMLNLMRYRPQLHLFPGAPAFSGTPQEANDLYERQVTPLLLSHGGYPLFSGKVQARNLIGYDPEVDDWSRVLVVRSRSRRAFLDLMTDPNYAPIEPYKLMAFDANLTPMSAELTIPDVRIAAIVVALLTFLAAGWWCANRRRRQGG